MLLGYLLYQLFTMLPEGTAWLSKSLLVVLKPYTPMAQHKIALYSGKVLRILSVNELFVLLLECRKAVQDKILKMLQ